ncbi:MAG: ATP-binding protein, partial [Suipraeoptans sp.]
KASLLGGGMYPKPGEITLSHAGVLFMDEITEFRKDVIEVLRQPMEEKKIVINRNHGRYIFPAEFILVAACNPCPCGEYPDMNKCNCTHNEIRKYMGRLSSPFLDRIDLCIEISKIPYEDLNKSGKEETSDIIRKRVEKVREIQALRYKGNDSGLNAQMTIKQLNEFCKLDKEGEKIMQLAYNKMGLTARSYHKILKVARTIADMECNENISSMHLKEAIGYRIVK